MAFYHKRADFWLPNFGFKISLLSLLKQLLPDNCLCETAEIKILFIEH